MWRLPYVWGVWTKATLSVAKYGQRLVEELRPRREVGVEDGEELTVGDRERVVEVAGLGTAVVGPTHVLGPELERQLTDLVRPAVVEHQRAVAAADRQRRGDGTADHVEVLAVGGDEDVDRGLLVVDPHRPPARAGLQSLGRDLPGIEEAALGLVVGEVAGVVPAGEDGPQGEQRLRDQERLGGDDEGERQEVAVVGRPEDERRVGQHTDRGQQDQHHQGRRAGLGGVAGVPGAQSFGARCGADQVVEFCGGDAVLLRWDRCPSTAKRRPEGRGQGVRARGRGGVRLRERTSTGGTHRVPRTGGWIDPT